MGFSPITICGPFIIAEHFSDAGALPTSVFLMALVNVMSSRPCPPDLSVECNPLVGCWAAHDIYYNIYGDTSLSTSLSLLILSSSICQGNSGISASLSRGHCSLHAARNCASSKRTLSPGGSGGFQGLHPVSLEKAAKSVVSPQSLSRPPLLEQPQSPVPLVLPWPWRVYVG